MRSLEIVLALAVALAIAWPVVFGTRLRRGWVAAALTLVLIAQLQIGGFRWQMLPLYAGAIALAGGDLFFIDRDLKWSTRVSRGVFGSLGLGVALLFPLVLPVPEFPAPSGPQAIGTFSVEVTDPERMEIYGDARPETPRRLVAQVWYPATGGAQGDRLEWSEDWDVVTPAMSRVLGLPSWFFDHTKYTYSNAIADAPVAPGAFPVVIYSHGWTGFRTVAVNQAEALASHGYIVIAVDHTYGSVAARFSDGSVIYHDPNALPDEELVEPEVYAEAAELLVETYAGDIVAVLNELDLDSQGAFADISGSADLTRIGIYGHSTGGGAAVRVCLEDTRCDAVLGMDAWVEPLPDRILKIEASVPSLFMRSDEWRGDDNDAILRGIAARSTAVSYVLGIDGADHNDFVVAPFISPFASRIGFKGPIAAGRIVPIIDNYLVGFFDVFLLDTGAAALDSVGFEEVSVEILNR